MSGSRARFKVLVIAYACNPYQGSEEGVGWGWVRAIARHHDLHVLTADYQREAIERHARAEGGSEPSVRWHFVPSRAWHYRPTPGWKRIEGSVWKPIMNLAYVSWQEEARRLAAKIHRRQGFDLVHLLTYVGFRFPGRFWRLGIPFVWGPIGGLENTPWRFLPVMGRSGLVYYGGRNAINTLQKGLLPGPRRAFRAGRGGVIAATRGIGREIRRHYRVESEVMCEIAAPPRQAGPPARRETGGPLQIGWSGLHLVGKALPLLLGALAKLPSSLAWRLTVMGQGNCTPSWQAEATARGIADRITWTGWLPRSDALARMRAFHVFVITSLKDLTSTVTLEALAQGVPVICLDHCGFADVITEACGLKVPVESPAQVERDLALALERVEGDEALRQRLAEGALARASEYTWEEKGRTVDAIYRQRLEAGAPPRGRGQIG